MTDFAALSAPFPPEKVSWRVGSTNKEKTKGMALAYIDARDVMDRLDEVVGPLEWSDRFEVYGSKTICYITINGVTKADGAGDTDVEAEKGSLSDSFKRAAVKWGIGRYLYDVDSPWVEIEPAGKSYRIKASEYAKLRRVLSWKVPSREAPPEHHPSSDNSFAPNAAQRAAATPPTEVQVWIYQERAKWLKGAKTPEELATRNKNAEHLAEVAKLTDGQRDNLRALYLDTKAQLQGAMLQTG